MCCASLRRSTNGHTELGLKSLLCHWLAKQFVDEPMQAVGSVCIDSASLGVE